MHRHGFYARKAYRRRPFRRGSRWAAGLVLGGSAGQSCAGVGQFRPGIRRNLGNPRPPPVGNSAEAPAELAAASGAELLEASGAELGFWGSFTATLGVELEPRPVRDSRPLLARTAPADAEFAGLPGWSSGSKWARNGARNEPELPPAWSNGSTRVHRAPEFGFTRHPSSAPPHNWLDR